MRFFSAVLTLVLWFGFSLAASAALTKGPYLENVTAHSITISFESDHETDGHVSYGIGTLDRRLDFDNGVGIQSVELEDLKPSTEYFYRLELHDGAFSPTLTFSTAPDGPEPFRFVVFGDTRTDHGTHRQVVALADELGGDFYLHTGDMVEDGDSAENWQTFFDIESPLMSRMVMWPVMGNHEHRSDTLYDNLFHTPTPPDVTRYYSFDFSNCHFTVIDSDTDFSVGSEQYQWLEADLSAASNDSAIDHIFALYHRPSYSSGWHGSEGLALAETFHPLFVKYGVEMVFNGHDHDYERSQVDGIYYVVAGGGGAPYPPLLPEDQAPNPDNNPDSQVFLGIFHAVRCDVTGQEVACHMVDLTRSVRDSFGINVSEKKPVEDACEPCDAGCSSVSAHGGLALLLLMLFVAFCLRRRKSSAQQDQDHQAGQ